MTVIKLRERLDRCLASSPDFVYIPDVARDAIAHAERLEAENKRLRDALVNSDVKIVYLLSDIAVASRSGN